MNTKECEWCDGPCQYTKKSGHYERYQIYKLLKELDENKNGRVPVLRTRQ